MRKYDFISALAKETAAEVVKNREEWMKYLTTAARLYKYPFREQLLIYAQRPDAFHVHHPRPKVRYLLPLCLPSSAYAHSTALWKHTLLRPVFVHRLKAV